MRELDRTNRASLINGVQMLVHALEAKDAYTSGHSSRVSRYAMNTAVLLGFTDDALEHIRLGGELHDIGKIGTREDILNKPGPLTPESSSTSRSTRRWARRSWRPFWLESPIVLRIVRSHHERMDGSGFPDALRGEPDSARGPHRRRGGCLRRDDHQPGVPSPAPVPRPSRSCGGVPACTSTPKSSRRSCSAHGEWRQASDPSSERRSIMSDTLMISVSGIRGHVGTDLTPELVARYAAALGAWSRSRAKVRPSAN